MLIKQNIIELYRPQIRLHHNEQYYPVTIDFALSACELWHKDTLILKAGHVNQKSLTDKSSNKTDLTNTTINKDYYLKIIDHKKLIGEPYKLPNIPIYATVSEIQYTDPTGQKRVYWDIAYHVLYLYNGPITLLGSEGVHYWDNEMAIIRIDPSKAPHIDAIQYIFLSQHSAGAWLKPNNFQFDGTHPIVYSARNSHAHYSTASYWPRLFAFASDRTSDNGIHWNPPVLYVDMSRPRTGNLLWTHYNGLMTKGGQAFPFFRGNISVNHKLYKKSTYDLVDKELGDNKETVGVGLIIVPIIMLIIGILTKYISILTIVLVAPLFYASYIGAGLYTHVGVI